MLRERHKHIVQKLAAKKCLRERPFESRAQIAVAVAVTVSVEALVHVQVHRQQAIRRYAAENQWKSSEEGRQGAEEYFEGRQEKEEAQEGELRNLHLQSAEASASRYWNIVEGYEHYE